MTTGSDDSTIRAVLVEGEPAQRSRLVSVLREDGDIVVDECPGTAADVIARVAESRPDVVILDLTLPNGQSQLVIEQVMARTPTPILVLSAGIRDRSSAAAVEALVAGALEALPRPREWTPSEGAELRRAVRRIRKVQVIRHPRGSLNHGRAPESALSRPPVVAVAASTGGPRALATLFAGFRGIGAPVLVVQHLHPDFTAGLVEWMGRVSAIPVETARHRQTPHPGRVYFAPGQRHLRYAASGRLELVASPATAHRPSADELFRSVAENAGTSAVGVLLTGMGEDGARGLLAIHEVGGRTFAQDEASSVVFGMPKAAMRAGAVTELLPIDKLADAVQRAVREVTPS